MRFLDDNIKNNWLKNIILNNSKIFKILIPGYNDFKSVSKLLSDMRENIINR